LSLLEGVVVDQTLVDRGLGVDPVLFGVPAHLDLVSERHVFDIEQHLGLALLVPHLASGVARVGQDDPHGGLAPRPHGSVGVTPRVGRGRRQDAIAGQALGDGVDTRSGQVFAVDALYYRGCQRLGFEAVQSFAVGGLARVGVRPGVGEPVAVGRPPAEESSFQRGLC